MRFHPLRHGNRGRMPIIIGVSKEDAPRGPAEDAIYARIGDPDTITGSGRSFLHYDLKNGQTLTIVVSGNEVIGAQVGKKETPNQVPEDTARKLADPQH